MPGKGQPVNEQTPAGVAGIIIGLIIIVGTINTSRVGILHSAKLVLMLTSRIIRNCVKNSILG